MKDLFSIGEVSKLFNINIRTLRYYDGIGLLKPTRVDEKTGYRYYSTKDFERLNTIKYLRALNMSLDNIALFFENKDISVMEELLKTQKEQIKKNIEELCRIRTKIDSRLIQLTEAECAQKEQITVKELEKRRVAILRKEIAVTDDLELPIRELESLHHLDSVIFLGKVGVSIDLDRLLNKEFGSFSSIFVLVEPSDELEGGGSGLYTDSYLEAGAYLSIYFQGTHTQAPEYYEKLLVYANQNNYEICGDSVEITLIDAGLTNDTSSYVTELQLPVILANR